MFKIMNNKSLAILKYFIEHTGDFHVREISRRTELSVGYVSGALRELEKREIVVGVKKGKMRFYHIDHDSPVVRQIKLLFTTISIFSLVKKLRPISRRIILFGSAARGTNMPDSDIDLFLHTAQKDSARKILAEYSKVIPIIMNSVEYSNLKKKDPSLFGQIAGGVVLWDADA